MPESGQIWLASNFADKKGFVTINNRIGNEIPEVLDPNNGELPNEKRIEMFINEYNGRYWEKKVMDEGTTIVIERPCFDEASGTTIEYTWYDSEGKPQYITIDIPKVAQENIEYRVYKSEDGCDKVLKNTDDLVVERALSIIVPIIDNERWEREEADVILSGAIETEREERISADTELSGAIETLREDLDSEIERAISAETELWDALTEEASARTEADEVLSGAIDTLREDLDSEIERAISAETALDEKIDEEIDRAISAETALDEKIDEEIERAISAETYLDEKIDEETDRAISAETALDEKIDEEIERATQREDEIDGQLIDASQEYTISVSSGDGPNVTLKSKDNNEDHFIKLHFDGNFGSI
jgi:hypothetical protein